MPLKLFGCTFLTCYFLLNSYSAVSQKAMPVITGEFKSISAEQFFLQLEKQTGYNFYFDASQLDSITVNISVEKKRLEDVLKQAFVNTNVGFTKDAQNNFFISRGQLVQTELPDGFFGTDKNDKNDIQDTSNIDYGSVANKVQNATLQNKLYTVGEQGPSTNQAQNTINGFIADSKSGEPVIGASVHVENSKIDVITDQYGYYTISLPKGRHTLSIQSIGMKDTKREILVKGNGKFNIEMQTEVIALKKVVVSTQKASNIRSLQMGIQTIDIKTIKQVPVVFGEADILRVVLTLPGVKSVGEASTGLNVRGGSADQNLILFNDATIYNPSHFFGLFSAFNPEVVKDVELYKSSIPAKYGGRLSSVLEINSREGNKKNITGTAGVGLLTSRLTLEGPLIKDKSSFIIGGRTTYARWLLNLLPDEFKNSKAGFYDVNVNISHGVNKKNSIYLTGYLSKDNFNLNSDTTYNYGNNNISLKWKHIFHNKLYALITAGYDNYQYKISSAVNPINAYSLGFNINQTNFKAHFNYFVNSKHTIEFGLNNILYKLNPGTYKPVGKESLVAAEQMQAEQALESALYVSDKYNITSGLSVEAGVRYSVFNVLGPRNFNEYAKGVPKTVDNITGINVYGKNKFIKTYHGPEVRFSARYAFSGDFSIKAGYNSQRQYIHVLSNTAAVAPTDIWKLSDPNIKPQYGDQVSLGFYKNFKSNTIETSVEVYYKKIKDYLDYKSGAVLVLNQHIETDVINTKGKAYGVEFLLKKLTGKLNGWLSYTYSRTLLKMDDPTAGEVINKGMYYPANSDKPHDITFISNYRISHRFSFSLNATYSTGRPITLPIGRFFYSNGERTLYADRNANRIPDYFRTDFSMNLEGNHKVHQKTHNSWTAGVYNLTGRKNPYSVYFISENGVVNGYKLSIFGSPIPFINYNIKF
ncbi:MAG: carboxypeptidase-like regulatory domain-containing protein [Ginsengibacter sp.]